MAWTQADIDKLKAAMGQGLKSVQYTSGKVEYQSVADMQKLLQDMEREVSGTAPIRRTVVRYSSGF